ncbi:MAG: N-6 DNA methylase [Candidatus Electryonea clarkiae]|nr:N-6 DNA methylase [Candidatus Electryonea clarkiae]MDP8287780.1 N-6 DNA methylase [Candidatus Electryonea clarkiae]
MLDTDTKHRIDTARDILVGKVPDPKSQVEQITIAMIYKFMDDMDAESEEFGGKRKFFEGEFARYGWAKLMHSGLGGFETLNLYAEAITKMPENPGIPLLFRDIFKNAFLPYRDPETLKMFLKVIDEFEYDHSERLGDAFEYLLSVLGSQGDAGQFRTPRHIIDFMVEIVDPKKTETVLDPACGTAGFLISSYKHILKSNKDADGNSTLTPDEKGRLAHNFKGYDISPDMVRLSLVNMYLHGFTDPHIYEYDTLTSQDRWNEYADVILANPPFMSPKGGIKPHKRFTIQAKRSEVLFVDYMAEHLTPTGRAGIIVPEGIIFQSQNAYKQLRKMLVEEYLVAVVSLPAGVFNPYSGVKTSILILDKSLAKKTNSIAFFKVENDGFGLGAQRREIEKNDLPAATDFLKSWLQSISPPALIQPIPNALIVEKEKIAAKGDYNLSRERYRQETRLFNTKWPTTALEEICTFMTGGTPTSTVAEYYENGTVPWLVSGDIHRFEIADCEKRITSKGVENSNARFLLKDSVLIALNGQGKTRGTVALLRMEGATCNQSLVAMTPAQPPGVISEYIFWVLRSMYADIRALTGHNQRSGLNISILKTIQIPLPPLEVQKEIVVEIEGYQKVIDGARAVLDNYRPHIPINPDWPMVELKEIIDSLESGVSVNSTNNPINEGEIGILKTSCVTSGVFDPKEHKTVLPDERSRVKCHPKRNSIIISRMNTERLVGANAYVKEDFEHLFLPDRLWQTVISRNDVHVLYLQTILASDTYRKRISAICGGTSGSMKNISKGKFLQLDIPLPPLATQQAIVAEIEAEQTLVVANCELIDRFEKKIQVTLERIWSDNK